MEQIPLSDGVIAAMIGAVGTMATAFFHLVASGRKSASESRARRKTPWLLIFALMLTSAVGGFAYAEYRNWGREETTERLRAEVTKLTQLAAFTGQPQSLQHANALMGGGVPVPTTNAMLVHDQLREAIVGLPVCKGNQVGFATGPVNCSEAEALHAMVCVPVPANVLLKSVELYARPEDSPQPWAETRLAPDTPPGKLRADAKYSERLDPDGSRAVCQGIAHWDSDKGKSVRIVVRFGA